MKNAFVLCGFMGCGKTTLGKQAASQLQMEYLDADEYIQQQAGITIPEIFARFGEGHFRQLEHEAMAELSRRGPILIASGGGALTYPRNVQVVRENAYILYIDVDFSICYERIAGDTNRPLVVSNSRQSLQQLYHTRDALYRSCADAVISNNTTPDAGVQALCDFIRRHTTP